MRLCFALCFLGRLPRYFPLFLSSCERNPDVDFLIISDREPPRPLGPNMRWVQRDLGALQTLFSDKLGLPVEIPAPYKLCDFKTTYGLVLEDWLGDYDFWGICDADLVFGNIRHFARHSLLEAHDVLSFRGRGYISGPCTLFRNTERVNRLFEQAPHFRDILQDPECLSFTEVCRRWKSVGREPEELVREGLPVSMTDVLHHEVREGRLSFYDEDYIVENDPAASKPVRMRWTHGELYDEVTKREILLYHLLFAKDRPFFFIPEWDPLPDTFRISNEGIREGTSTAPDASFRLQRATHGVPKYLKQFYRRGKTALERRVPLGKR